MKIKKTNFKDLLIIENQKYTDPRGEFRELLIEKEIKIKFPFNVISISKKNVIRGLHYQIKKPQGKFISVLKGEILDVALDLRKKSKTFGKHYKIVLSEKNCKSIYIHEGFAH
jgi:dTDP-4-dehydrorhamnose 3,5-epimerase